MDFHRKGGDRQRRYDALARQRASRKIVTRNRWTIEPFCDSGSELDARPFDTPVQQFSCADEHRDCHQRQGDERLQRAGHGFQVHPYEMTESDLGYVREINRVRTRTEIKQDWV